MDRVAGRAAAGAARRRVAFGPRCVYRGGPGAWRARRRGRGGGSWGLLRVARGLGHAAAFAQGDIDACGQATQALRQHAGLAEQVRGEIVVALLGGRQCGQPLHDVAHFTQQGVRALGQQVARHGGRRGWCGVHGNALLEYAKYRRPKATGCREVRNRREPAGVFPRRVLY